MMEPRSPVRANGMRWNRMRFHLISSHSALASVLAGVVVRHVGLLGLGGIDPRSIGRGLGLAGLKLGLLACSILARRLAAGATDGVGEALQAGHAQRHRTPRAAVLHGPVGNV